MGTRLIAGAAGALLLAAAAAAETAEADPAAAATLRDRQGGELGTARLTETPNGLLLDLELAGAPPGAHGFHIHETGLCEPPFESAGGHFARAEERHGFRDAAGPHAGDLSNLHVPESGALRVELFLPGLALDEALLDEDGAALVLHQDADDHMTDPAGESGDRIACGVIERAG